MAVKTTNNKPLNPRGQDQSPKGYNRAALYSGKALDFDGVNDSVNLDGFTMAGDVATIVFYGQFDSTGYAIDINTQRFIIQNHNTFGFRVYNNNVWTAYGDTNRSELNFYAIVSDGTTQRAYYNGHQLGSDETVTALDWSLATQIRLGSDNAGSGSFLNGQLSGFKIFNTALTPAQVSDLYNNPEKIVPTGVEDTALKLWLPMQEGAGTTAINGAPDALQDEEVTNGDFATDSNWSKGTGWSISGGLASCDGTQTANSDLGSTAMSGLNNKGELLIEVVVDSVTAGSLSVTLQGSNTMDINDITSAGTYRVLCQTTDAAAALILRANSIFVGSVSSVSLKELANCGSISGATWTHGIGAPVSQTAVINWNKGNYINDGGTLYEALIPQGLTSGRDLLGNLFENVRKQGALNLDGNSRVSVHENASIDLSDCSLEAWVCPLPESDSGWTTIFSKVSQANLQIYLDAADLLSHYNTATAGGVLYSTAFNKNEWHHIVCVEDGTDVLTYVDGVLRTTKTISLQMDSDGDFSIGSKPGVLADEITAQIAQPRIYNRALTAEEVERNYTAGKYIYTND